MGFSAIVPNGGLTGNLEIQTHRAMLRSNLDTGQFNCSINPKQLHLVDCIMRHYIAIAMFNNKRAPYVIFRSLLLR